MSLLGMLRATSPRFVHVRAVERRLHRWLIMWKSILAFFGIRQARRHGWNPAIAPIGGLVPMLAWFAWKNRRQIGEAYRTHVAPRLGVGMSRASHA